MEDEKQRITWIPRVSILPSVQRAVQQIAKEEKVPVAYVIGTLLANQITARSTS